MVDRSLIVTPADIFHLSDEEIIQLDLFEKKRTENLLKAIEQAKDVPFSRFLFSVGIRHVGEKTSRDLVKELQKHLSFHQSKGRQPADEQETLFFMEANDEKIAFVSPLEIFDVLSKEETRRKLDGIEGIGPKVLEALEEWFSSHEHRDLCKKFTEFGVRVLKEVFENIHDPVFDGKTFVITGTFEKYSREELKHIILRRGGKVSSSVTSKTNAVLVGENPGSKLKKAQELGVEVWDEGKVEKILSSG